MYIEQEDILIHISAKPFHIISEAADELGVEAYVIGKSCCRQVGEKDAFVRI